ncbi:hypothetical protein [Brucella pseudintermedia]|uniref:cation transporter dimerization domain-containing protein n=1 Tax=Brucella pseudintermedia TaxID=370111 RepID=UPI003D1671E3
MAALHDLHIWSLTKNQKSLTAHIVLTRGADGETVRRAVEHLLQEQYDLHHTTLQTEAVDRVAVEQVRKVMTIKRL